MEISHRVGFRVLTTIKRLIHDQAYASLGIGLRAAFDPTHVFNYNRFKRAFTDMTTKIPVLEKPDPIRGDKGGQPFWRKPASWIRMRQEIGEGVPPSARNSPFYPLLSRATPVNNRARDLTADWKLRPTKLSQQLRKSRVALKVASTVSNRVMVLDPPVWDLSCGKWAFPEDRQLVMEKVPIDYPLAAMDDGVLCLCRH
ncbi:hypothetical protein BCR34DRAFT_595813 [Clohesyomyces aquaticus]|uniref:Uncharacterized protein n=1 Tax=Clohesyomyces aquaticus TaxID=1231657 RepID=A0A1Y2AAH0_9PLEO|nr:hypothetical protein BCR34DRAFT_595813 [Clohesyomyces aquaticus]